MNTKSTLLVVDDDEDDAFFMRRALRAVGGDIDPRVVIDGRAALDYLRGTGPFTNRAAHPFPALVFLDLKMPGMHGFEVLEHIRADPALKDLRVYVVTSSGEARDRERAQQLGAAGYIVKPPTRENLQAIFAGEVAMPRS